ncbi:vicilin-like seed storage protein At2g28490 [Abrus precatorius]|uniref:Vicilin-like seed storage protein At2g28490 n=1 Tax=Abrus precatorius TaxID=3816 RepID=A0A8B8KNI7_ABRPR|nr:vicilin-like seed storage protein At2g28490 [Abrus precatorius]
MGNIATLLLLLFVFCHGVAIAESPSSSSTKLFLMQNSKRVVKTDAGEMRVMKSYGGRILDRHMQIGFISMEPMSLFIPQYLDSNLIIFIRRGEAKLGFIYDDKLAERRLKTGDVYIIPAGSAFYLVNLGAGQRLHIICSINPSSNLGVDTFQSFYIGGGANAPSVLYGFESVILEAAFNESRTVLRKIFTKELDGPIVYVTDTHAPRLWTKFLQLKKEDKVQHLKKIVQDQEEEEEEEEKETSWSWRKFMETILGNVNEKIENKHTAGSPDSYNLHDKKPDFRNAYGWSKTLDGAEYPPLRKADIGIFHVNLTAGSMMAPHLNPRATEYGIVLRGYGRIQILFPNGSNAMNTEIKVGDVFVVPRYFPFCQIASRNGPLEFFGFSTSARKNKPQFLAGAVSLVTTMMGPELAAAFGVSEDTMRRTVDAQHEAVILPSTWAAPPEDPGKMEEEKVHMQPKAIRSFAKDIVMDVF